MNVAKLPNTAEPIGDVRISAAAEMNSEGFLQQVPLFFSPHSSSDFPRITYASRQSGYGR